MAPADTPRGRVLGLDLMRVVAVLFVVISHGYELLDRPGHRVDRLSFVIGGVPIFFVLSVS
jgi:peptidoglycan/LPS O-acetylase OafA/YrhL